MIIDTNGRIKYSIKGMQDNQDISSNINLLSVTVHLLSNKLPTIQCIIQTMDPNSYFNYLNDYNVTLEANNDFKVTYPMGVSKVSQTSNKVITLSGYLAERDSFITLGSEYLAESLDQAVQSLGIRDTIRGVDSITGDYWRVNETKLECLVRLLRGGKTNSLFSITESAINMISFDDQATNPLDYVPPTEVSNITSNDRFINDDYNVYASDESDEDNTNDVIYNATWNSLSIVGYEHKDFITNYVSSLTTQYSINRSIKFRYMNTYIEYNPGDVMKLDTDTYGYGEMMIIDKSLYYDVINGHIITELLLGSNK